MADKDKILKRVQKIEDRLLVSKVLDKLEKANRQKCLTYTDFLDPYQRGIIEKALGCEEDTDVTFEGGYYGAERVMMIFRPDFIYDDYDTSELPIKVIGIELNKRSTLSHRDYLGALMSLGIKREKVGDILVGEDTCDIVVSSDVAEYISYNLTRIGNLNITAEIHGVEKLESHEPKTREIKATVASLRLDSVASAGFGISRSKMAEFIKAERVNLNWETTSSLTKQVNEGDTVSIKGKGRVVLSEVGRTTRKGRIAIVLKKYI